MGGRLEHEIRLLPQVISCSFSKDDYVVVLIEPSADPHTIQVSGIAPLQRVSVPVEAPNHTLRALPFSRGLAVEAVSLTKAVPPIHHAKAKPTSVEAAHDHHGKAGHHGKHKGKGPKPWSHSVLLPSHDQRGKGANHG